MDTPSSAQLLTTWERGQPLAATARAWLLLRASVPAADDATLADLSVGAADRRLLALREQLFGQEFQAVCRCPRCDESIEITFNSGDLPKVDDALAASAVRSFDFSGQRIAYRLPAWSDLTAVMHAPDRAVARLELVRRCLVSSNTATPAVAAPCDESVATALAAALEADDPMAGTRLALHCPACRHGWSVAFDVAGYLWAELDQWARQTLREVHQLALAYGWTEAETLALSPRRRRLYLEMIAS